MKLILSQLNVDDCTYINAIQILRFSLNTGCVEILEELVYFFAQKLRKNYDDFRSLLDFPLNYLTLEDIDILHSGNFINLRNDLKLHMTHAASFVKTLLNSMSSKPLLPDIGLKKFYSLCSNADFFYYHIALKLNGLDPNDCLRKFQNAKVTMMYCFNNFANLSASRSVAQSQEFMLQPIT